MHRCRSCPAEIVWTETTNGRRMPVDVTPVDQSQHKNAHGLFVLDPPLPDTRGITPVAMSVDHLDPSVALYTSHFATCPYARAHRQPRPTSSPVVGSPASPPTPQSTGLSEQPTTGARTTDGHAQHPAVTAGSAADGVETVRGTADPAAAGGDL